MIKKSIVPRIVGILAGYVVIFFVLVLIQFTKYGNFTKRINGLTVSAQYVEDTGAQLAATGMSGGSFFPPGADWRAITGKATVNYRGVEYRLTEENRVEIRGSDGYSKALLPEYLAVSESGAAFRFAGGTVLSFSLSETEDGGSLAIRADFALGAASLELPYRLLPTSRTEKAEDGSFIITYNDSTYAFAAASVNQNKQTLTLNGGKPLASYRAVVVEAPVVIASGQESGVETPVLPAEEPVFNPRDFVIMGAVNPASYTVALGQWRGQNVASWRSSVNETRIMALVSESLQRGGVSSYDEALAAVPSSYLNRSINGVEKTFESSPFFGSTEQALRALISFERDTSAHISQEISSQSLDFFLRDFPRAPSSVAYLAMRGETALLDAVAAWAHALDPSQITADHVPGVLESYLDWAAYRSGVENPFAHFSDRVYALVSAGIRKNSAGDKVFVFNNGLADMLFNLRLGMALSSYAEETGNADWAAAGRSVILSVLSMTNASGLVPRELLVSDIMAAVPSSPEAAETISSAELYRGLADGGYFPHTAGVKGGTRDLWVWTVSSKVDATAVGQLGASGSSIDISVDFPAGATHYMLIRNVPPSFVRLQLYNMNYRTDPNFERYNSSGWRYSASEQTLLVKMRHRENTEYIRIYW